MKGADRIENWRLNNPDDAALQRVNDNVQGKIARAPKKIRVGLVNQGHTCYINSVLQCLFMSLQFRHDLLTLQFPERGVASMLQRVFTKLHFSKAAVHILDELLLLKPDYFPDHTMQEASEYCLWLLSTLDDTVKPSSIRKLRREQLARNARA